MSHTLSFESITPHLKNLRSLGFCQIEPQSPKRKRLLHTFYMAFVFNFIAVYVVQQGARVYQVRDDADKLMNTLFLMLTNSDFMYKHFIIWLRQDRVEDLLNIMKGPWFNQNVPEYQVLLLERGRQARLLLRAFNITALSTCLLWVLYPAILYAQHKPVDFAIWLPFDPNMSPQFYVTLIYVWVQTSLLAYGNTSMDAFITLFFAQSKTQLSILRCDLENIVEKCIKEAKEKSIPFTEIFHQRFHGIMLHYKDIVRLCSETQNIFGGVILYQFMISGWIISTSAYRMININPVSVEFSSMILYMTCIFTEIFLYCYYGNEVAYESLQLLESVFKMDWYKIPIECRYPVIIFMERIKRPITPIAGGIIPLSNNTFVSIIRSSYTFYAFLKNTK